MKKTLLFALVGTVLLASFITKSDRIAPSTAQSLSLAPSKSLDELQSSPSRNDAVVPTTSAESAGFTSRKGASQRLNTSTKSSIIQVEHSGHETIVTFASGETVVFSRCNSGQVVALAPSSEATANAHDPSEGVKQALYTLPGAPWPSLPEMKQPTLTLVKVQPIFIISEDDDLSTIKMPVKDYGPAVDWITNKLNLKWQILEPVIVRSNLYADPVTPAEYEILTSQCRDPNVLAAVQAVPNDTTVSVNVMSMTGTPRGSSGARGFSAFKPGCVVYHGSQPFFGGALVYTHEWGHTLGLGHTDEMVVPPPAEEIRINVMHSQIFNDSYRVYPPIQGPASWRYLNSKYDHVYSSDPSRPTNDFVKMGEDECLAWHSPEGYAFTVEESTDFSSWSPVPGYIMRPSTGWADSFLTTSGSGSGQGDTYYRIRTTATP